MPEEKQQEARFVGTTFNLGGREYVVPSLSVKQARSLWSTILEMDEGVTQQNLPEKWSGMIKVIHTALTRNYPNVKIEDLEELVDMTNVRDLVRTVCGNSGVGAQPGPRPVAVAKEVA